MAFLSLNLIPVSRGRYYFHTDTHTFGPQLDLFTYPLLIQPCTDQEGCLISMLGQWGRGKHHAGFIETSGYQTSLHLPEHPTQGHMCLS